MKINEFIGKTAARIVSSSDANILLVTKDPNSDSLFNLTVFREDDEKISKTIYSVNVSKLPAGSVAQMRSIVVEAINKDIIKSGEYVFCIADESLGKEFDGLFLLFKIDDNFLNVTKKRIESESKMNVFETVLNIAKEIGREGREGRKIGTAFVIGDTETVMKHSSQLILNPFEGHLKRNVMNAELKETVKEFAQLDGAFVIGDNGMIHSAGRYLAVDTSGIDLPGLGARHLSAAAITRATKAVSIVVSESGGIVRVFKDGHLVMEEIPA